MKKGRDAVAIDPLLDPARALDASDTFARRHLGPRADDLFRMLEVVGYDSLDALTDAAVPASIRLPEPLKLTGDSGSTRGEFELLASLKSLTSQNKVLRSCIGMGYSDTIVPPVIQRNILENPGWYTQYTPYQAEISQGRLESLMTFQTAICDLTGLPMCNASLLDEASAAAEAMGMCHSLARGNKNSFFVAEDCHPHVIGVVHTRAEAAGVEVIVGPVEQLDFERADLFGILLQYPTTDGRLVDPRKLIERAHAADAHVVMSADLLALVMLTSPGELGADIAVGSSQRFGVPMGLGGPHAGFLSTTQKYVRKLPGRLVGLSQDSNGEPAYRLALQTREQHIRRDKATSNICTAQALLANMAAMYAVYHGPEGLRRIATRVHGLAAALASGLRSLGHELGNDPFFDTLRVRPAKTPSDTIIAHALDRGINLRPYEDGSIGVAFDETTTRDDLQSILEAFCDQGELALDVDRLIEEADREIPAPFARESEILRHDVFNRYHSETEMLRYITRLESKDLSLTTSMIPLGSCTMKLNPTTAMLPVTWPEIGRMHPFAPEDQWRGYEAIFEDLETWLGEVTKLPAVSLQPNAGSQGELSGLLAIRAYHQARGDDGRNVCLIPTSAHGTNAASAAIAGFECIAVKCDDHGNVDIADLEARSEALEDRLGALMITYPSTHGVFEAGVREVCEIVHRCGGQVYMDGANMNAQVGLTAPGEIGADVCHLNLHKTFTIPHGGGGPGVGPIAAAEHLRPYLPGHPIGGERAVTSAPYGSASILPITWVYIALMGAEGLLKATQVAILNANYMAKRLEGDYDVLYVGPSGLVAHEFIIDCRSFDKSAGVSVEDIAKRLMDYGFHAPTMSFPVAGTLMIEPTESESREELDRLCDALIAIRGEIRDIESGKLDREDNPLKHAPHTAQRVCADDWPHAYSRELAAYPAPWVREHKFWPASGRIDNAYGDRHLICTHPHEAFSER